MGLPLAAVRPPLSVPRRWMLFGVAVVAGTVAGNTVNVEPSDWAYNGLLNLFADPGIQIASMATGVGLGFVLGLIHLTSI
jgi:hypothetical protein